MFKLGLSVGEEEVGLACKTKSALVVTICSHEEVIEPMDWHRMTSFLAIRYALVARGQEPGANETATGRDYT